jgi:Flp pilus assembly protein TadG
MFFSKKREEKLKKMQQKRTAYLEQLALIRQFKKDDEGGLIILTLLLLISMLVVGGMAVDFMRFEAERTKLQSVSDRAVLAAANLNQELAPAAIIQDFFDAEGYGGAITSELTAPSISKNSGGSTITITSEVNVNTFYLRLIGMDTLTAPASSSAIAGTGNVEVSLILDISGSMGREMEGEVYQFNSDGEYIRYTEEEVEANNLDPTLVGAIKTEAQTQTRMFFLQQAANKFVADLLLPEYEDRVSINLVAYSQHVSIGDELYMALRTTPDSMAEDGTLGSSFGQYDITDNYSEPFRYIYEAISSDPGVEPREVIWVDLDGNASDPRNQGGKWVYADEPTREFTGEPTLRGIEDYPIDVSWAGGQDIFVNASRCVTFTDEEYTKLEFDVDRVYQQVEHVDFYSRSSYENFRPSYTPCPAQDFQGIILLSQDVEELQDAISSYVPTLNTSIHRGMKWGTALLDPSMRPILDTIPTIDPAFRGSRPANYRDGVTSKYVVIMTDGETVSSRRVVPQYYNEYDELVGYRDHNARYWASIDPGGSGTTFSNMTQSIGSTTQLNEKLASLCEEAAKNVTDVYTISMGVNNATMRNCASKDGNAFQSSITNDPNEPGMGEIFERISSQITALRLSQ